MKKNKYDTMKVIEGCNNKAREVLMGEEWVLYSYDTPVAALRINNKVVRLWDGYTATTMKHINRWLGMHGLPTIEKAKWDKMEVEAD